jgi:hypothetical protein
LKAIVYLLYPSTIAWIPYDDLWEFLNTIEQMTMDRLPRLFKVETGNLVKMGVVAGSTVAKQKDAKLQLAGALKRDTEAKQNDAKCVAVGDSMLSNV